MISNFRGYPICWDESIEGYRFVDTNEPTVEAWEQRPCGHCGLYNTPEGYDGCLGTIPKAINACCGHGSHSEAYVQFEDGSELRGEAVTMKFWRG